MSALVTCSGCGGPLVEGAGVVRAPKTGQLWINGHKPADCKRFRDAQAVRSFPKAPPRVVDEPFKHYVRSLPCVMRRLVGVQLMSGKVVAACNGGPWSDPNHAGKHGLGVKSGDDECIPMCRGHHTDYTTYKGFFDPLVMTLAQRVEWASGIIAEVQARYARHCATVEAIPW